MNEEQTKQTPPPDEQHELDPSAEPGEPSGFDEAKWDEVQWA